MGEEKTDVKAAGEKNGITLAEVETHASSTNLWLVIHGKVYDVSPFFDDHPGGGEVMLHSAGKDATDDFEDVGHSKHARDLLAKYLIGDYAGGESQLPKKAHKPTTSGNPNALAKLLQLLLPIVVILLAVAVFYVNTSK